TGVLLENRKVNNRLFSVLPFVMLFEAVLSLCTMFLFSLDASAYYLAAMVVFGLFSSTVTYLMQELKQLRYRTTRAAFDRRFSMADAAGYMLGSSVLLFNLPFAWNARLVLGLDLIQLVLVYLCYLAAFRHTGRGD